MTLKYKRHFELCDELLSLALQALPLIPPQSKTYAEMITAFFFRAINSFRSITVLCKEGLGNDAGIILRSLLNLAYLVKWGEENKEESVQRFHYNSLLTQGAMYDIKSSAVA